jgi:hypothetical protein
MYLILKGKSSLDDKCEDSSEDITDDNKPNDDDAIIVENSSGKRPTDWFFHGWISFSLFGHFAPTKRYFFHY